MKFILFFFFLILSLGAGATSAGAVSDPREVPNNRFGIHVIDENDLEDAQQLVNSTGGDWGYVTIVIREEDRNTDKWQSVFDTLRRAHLIPLVRLATRVEQGGWIKPRAEDIGSWVDFLDSLNWVVENRYVIIFNEPNHAKEWGNELNPEEYAWYLAEFATKLKEKSPDFFILPAGLDASAPNGPETMDELTYLRRMHTVNPNVFAMIDGWNSHSYPNPDFSGSPNAHGRGTVRTFLWEKTLLEDLGVTQDLPVFITETGWKHTEGKRHNRNYQSPEIVADHFHTAYATAWTDPDVVAVTPFLLNYQDTPFDQFSWRIVGSEAFHPMYQTIQALPKTAGQPKQLTRARFTEKNLPDKLITNSVYSLYLDIENTGQSIIGGPEWTFEIEGLPDTFEIVPGEVKQIEPFERAQVEIKLRTPQERGEYDVFIRLLDEGKSYATFSDHFALIAPPSLVIRAKLWFQKLAQGGDYSLKIFDDQRLLHNVREVPFTDGTGRAENLYNIIPNESYRLILSKPYYLPREVEAMISEGETVIAFPTLLPLDPSNDGKLGISDVGEFFRHPLRSMSLLVAL